MMQVLGWMMVEVEVGVSERGLAEIVAGVKARECAGQTEAEWRGRIGKVRRCGVA